ncbi:hypothetical protein [Acidianus sp. HS-5]|uniref:hypothetical protein n=1 Tax=Acidianus sp. HS-5 TaxID=2886040 RepID=UPI001F1582A0|nr:hypothetical protein [Acidianus sp. HS-5]
MQKILLEDVVEKVFNNCSIVVSQTVILPNISAYFSPTTFIQNANCSEGFFYISPSLLGHNTSSFIYNGTKDGLYIYYTKSCVFCSRYIFILYYNASGIPVKGCEFEYYCGGIKMKAIYTLWRTNLIINETIPSFPDYTLAKSINYNFSSAEKTKETFHYLLLGITAVGVLATLIILLFRQSTGMGFNAGNKAKFSKYVLVPMALYTLEKVIIFLITYVLFGNLFLYKVGTNWDASSYEEIAKFWYSTHFLYAFSPVFPSLIRGLAFIDKNYLLSALVITNVFGYVFVFLTYKYYGFKGSLLLSIFPVYALFSTIPYSDDIALTFLIMAINLSGWLSAFSLPVSIATFYNLAYILPSFFLSGERTS